MNEALIAVRIAEAVRLSGIGRSKLYELIGSGRIEAVKAGSRTLVLVDSLRQYIASLPRLGERA